MSGNIKFRFLLAPIVLALFFVATSPVSWAGQLEYAQERIRQNLNDVEAYYNLGYAYGELGQHQEATASYVIEFLILVKFNEVRHGS